MKILITGGAGYVGNILSRELLNKGHEVTILDNFLYGFSSVLHLVGHPKLNIIKKDIRDADRHYIIDHDVVYHLAAISGYPACEASPNSAHMINVVATKEIVDSLSDDQLLIYASTTSLYGSADGNVCREDGPVDTSHNLYSFTKYEAEKYCMDRENTISLRWATVFGVSSRMRAGLLMNDFVQKAVQERTLVVYSGHSKRTFMHVLDSVYGYLFALDHVNQMTGGIFNMGDANLNYSKIDLVNMLKKHIDFEVIESGMTDKDIRDFNVSFEKAEKLGYGCKISVEEGIEELVKLYSFYTPNSFIRPI